MPVLPLASYRGASFYCRNIRDRNGRQYAVHQYPNQKKPFIEDLGYKTVFFEFEGFVSTDENLYISRDLLEAAIRTKGLGFLIHPTRGLYRAACLESEFSEEINEKGLVQCRLIFVAASVKPSIPLTPLGLIDTQGDLLEDAFSGLSGLGSGLGALGSTLISGAVTGAVTAVSSIGTSGIDSIFNHSTSGRYYQSYSDSSSSVIQNVQNSSATSDQEKSDVATQTAIENRTNGISNLSEFIEALTG